MPKVNRQPPEDMYDRPTGPRHEDLGVADGRETPGKHTSLDDLPDGESVQSDKGETPVPATTRESHGTTENKKTGRRRERKL